MTTKSASKTATKGPSVAKNAPKKDSRKGAGKRNHDWDRIERDYRAGLKSQAQIAREHGLSEAAISKRAKNLGWKRGDLSDAIRKASSKLNVHRVIEESKEPIKPKTAPELDAETVEQYSGLVAAILGDHQALAKRLRGTASQLVSEIEAALTAIEPAIAEMISDRKAAIRAQKKRRKEQGEAFNETELLPYSKADLLKVRLGLLNKVVDLKRKTVPSLDRLIQLERQSYGLQDGDGQSDGMSYDDLIRDLHGV